MTRDVINLVSSDSEEDGSPRKAATSALSSFLPRKQSQSGKKDGLNNKAGAVSLGTAPQISREGARPTNGYGPYRRTTLHGVPPQARKPLAGQSTMETNVNALLSGGEVETGSLAALLQEQDGAVKRRSSARRQNRPYQHGSHASPDQPYARHSARDRSNGKYNLDYGIGSSTPVKHSKSQSKLGPQPGNPDYTSFFNLDPDDEAGQRDLVSLLRMWDEQTPVLGSGERLVQDDNYLPRKPHSQPDQAHTASTTAKTPTNQREVNYATASSVSMKHNESQILTNNRAPLKIVNLYEGMESDDETPDTSFDSVRPFKRPRLVGPESRRSKQSSEQLRDNGPQSNQSFTDAHEIQSPRVVKPHIPKTSPSGYAPRQPLDTIPKAKGSLDARTLSPYIALDNTRPTLVTKSGDFSGHASALDTRVNSPSAGQLPPNRQSRLSPERPTSFLRTSPSHKEMLNMQPQKPSKDTPTNFGNRFTPEEDALLADLKEVKGITWDDMPKYFNGRTRGALQVRYSSKVKNRGQLSKPNRPSAKTDRPSPLGKDLGDQSDSAGYEAPARRQRKSRGNEPSAASGMVSWAEVKRMQAASRESEPAAEEPEVKKSRAQAQFSGERSCPKSMSRILRQREFGSNGGRGYSLTTRSAPDELKEHIFDNLGPLKYHKGTSGDVTCMAWSSNGDYFAAGSIAISDERSMQYNRPGNLLVGSYKRGSLRELPEHHLPRPSVDAKSGNVNSAHSMRETQDPRLFMTVANVQFSPDGSTLYSAGTDSMVRAYDMNADIDQTSCSYSLRHTAPLDLLSVSNTNALATACHQNEDDSINIYRDQIQMLSLSPSRAEQQTKRPIYPSALRWGAAQQHNHLLLAGFSIDSIDDERNIAGEICLWDVAHQRRIDLPVARNVFDVAWKPSPTSTSSIFAVASTPSHKVTRGTRTVVQCFAPNQGKASRVMEWECPAFDINDVVYCQHDDNLIAAGATDGKVYVWDQRFAGRKPTPLHVLQHGASLNVLDHDREREIADTGIRFLAWGATSSRLYTGSSDGVVKTWNPYMSTANAHVQDVATFGSAVMSGAFSPDYQDLLIGEDQGRINSLGVGHGEKTVRSMRKFAFHPAPAPEAEGEDRFAAAHELVRSGQIVLRPMGDLPTRQAVKGPMYSGPYLEPTSGELHAAEMMYESALNQQSRNTQPPASTAESDTTRQTEADSNKRLEQAEAKFAKLQSRRDDAAALHPQAVANQQLLHKAEKQRLKLEASLSRALECCKLDCNYLPASVDDGEVPDSHRSESRIPGNLLTLPPEDIALLTKDELVEAGLTSKCISCSAPARKPKEGFPLCDLCRTARKGLTAKCSQCSAAIRPQADENNKLNLCEKCHFACFRCSKVATISSDRRRLTCHRCDLTWLVGVLGYELRADLTILCRKKSTRVLERDLEFGEGEIERHAIRWGN